MGGYGQPASIFLRGSNAAHTLILQDGMRSNTATVAGTNLHLIDTTDIKQIEILKGPASVQYGTDAIGGVIQLISKTPTENSAFTTVEVGEKIPTNHLSVLMLLKMAITPKFVGNA